MLDSARPRRIAVTLGVVLAVTSACATTQSGPAPSKPTPSAPTATTTTTTGVPAQITAKYALGDFTTMDACTLVSLNDLQAKHQRVPQSFMPAHIDDCGAMVFVSASRVVEVTWGQLQTTGPIAAPDADHEDLGGGLILKRTPADASDCTQYLEFSDRVAMTIEANPNSTATAAELCGVVHNVATTIAKTLRGGKVAAHHIVRASSLLHDDACTMLPLSLARSVPGGRVKAVGTYPTHHSCFYASDDGRLAIALDFGQVSSDLGLVPQSTMTKVAGRPTALSKATSGDRSGACELVTSAGKAANQRGYSSMSVEALQLSVTRKGGAAPCADTMALAAKIWAKLPKL